MLDEIKMILKSHFCRKNVIICQYVRSVVMDVIIFPKKQSGSYIFGLSVLCVLNVACTL